MNTSWKLGLALCTLGALLGACGNSENGPASSSGPGDDAGAAVTFHRDVRPLIETHCSGCHSAGNVGPFALGYDASEWKDGTPSWAAAAVSAVQSRAMPPWMPDPECRDLEEPRRLSDSDIALFAAWRDAGFPQGKEADYVAPNVSGTSLGEPSLTVRAKEPYTPNKALSDDYRCFLIDASFERETYLVASDVMPGTREQVHHVILYAFDASRLAEAQQLDDRDPGPGYTCFGGPGVGGAQNIGGWVPGSVPLRAAKDSARVLRKGSRIVMQIHYNNDHADHDQGPMQDQTSAALWFLPEGQTPTYRINTVPIAVHDLEIAAGDPNSVQGRTFQAPGFGTIVGVLPHMHMRGKSIELTLKREQENACLSRIPDWDFHWQQGYRYTESAYVQLRAGDELELTCIYDNHDNNETVRWGEGTRDEMCLTYVEVQTAFAGGKTLESECPTYPSCVEACEQGDSLCIARCTAQTPSCSVCTTAALSRCAQGRCQEEGLALQACSRGCKGDAACRAQECRAPLSSFFSCMEPFLRDGSCDADFTSCGQ